MKTKSFLFGFSIFLNAVFFLFCIIALSSKNTFLSILPPEDKSITSASVVSVPAGSGIVFNSIEISLKQNEKAFIQFAVFADRKQSNLLLQALYDHNIISVSQAGIGIEITALALGSTLMQTITSEGIRDVALITVTEK